MGKELNPDLFGERKTVVSAQQDSTSGGSLRSLSGNLDFLDVDRKLLDLRNQFQTLHEEQKKISAQMQEWMKTTHLRLEKLQQQMVRFENSHNGLAQETGHKLAQIGHKFIERKSMDQKIQEMVDRYSGVIKSFEVRMHHLQKLLSEKESQMMSAQAELNQAKMEIARLKRI